MNQIKIGAVLNYVIIALQTLVGLLYTPFLIKMLGPSEYGLYSLAISLIGYITIMDFGFGNAIIRYTAKFRAEGKIREQYEMFGMFLLIYLIISVLSFFLAWILARNVDFIFGANLTSEEVSHLRIILILMAFNLAFYFPMSIWSAVITAYERFFFQKLLIIIRSILNPLVMIVLLMYGYKAVALVVVTTIFNVLTLLINYIYCVRKIGIKVKFARIKKSFLKEVSIYSFWVFLAVVVDQFLWNTSQLILGATCGTQPVAIFAVAMQLRVMFYSFSAAISSVFLPRVTMLITNGASNIELSQLFIRTGRIQNLVVSLIISGFIIFGQQFVDLWAGPFYHEVYWLCTLIFLAVYPSVIQNIATAIMMARNELRYKSLVTLFSAFGCAILSIPFSFQWGALGCIIATCIGIVITYDFILNVYYKQKLYLDIWKFWREILKMSIPTIIILPIGLIIVSQLTLDTFPKLFIAIGIFILLYVPLIYKFSMNMQERLLVNVLINRILHLCRVSVTL